MVKQPGRYLSETRPAIYCPVMSTPPFDTTKPNVARMYDYWLGGTDNFEAGREAAEAVRRVRPNVGEQALDNKRFQTRAVTYVAGHGVRQFLDVGSGLPTSPVRTPGTEPQWLATHDAARRVMPDAMVAYVDHDPVAVRHSRAHSWAELTGLFDGLELIPPGIVETSAWLPGQPEARLSENTTMIVAGVGRRP
jgi:S-adenosyl methyltransferase